MHLPKVKPSALLLFLYFLSVLTVVALGQITPGKGSGGSVGPSVAGSNTHVQFNDAGSLGANSAFTFDKTTGQLTATEFHLGTAAGHAKIYKNESDNVLLHYPGGGGYLALGSTGDARIQGGAEQFDFSTGGMRINTVLAVPALTAPVNGDFSWVNQGDASVATTTAGIYLSTTLTGDGLHLRVKSAPATPYTITANIVHGGGPSTRSTLFAGLAWRQSSDGKMVLVYPSGGGDNGPTFYVYRVVSTSEFGSAYVDTVSIAEIPHWLRLVDDGTNRKVFSSLDGVNWYQWHSVGRTDHITADQVGFFISGGDWSWGNSATLVSWKEQ